MITHWKCSLVIFLLANLTSCSPIQERKSLVEIGLAEEISECGITNQLISSSGVVDMSVMRELIQCQNDVRGFSIQRLIREAGVNDADVPHNTEIIYSIGAALLEIESGSLHEHAPRALDALRWLLISAERGHAESEYLVGKLYCCILREEDRRPTDSIIWLRRASERGHADASKQLGLLHACGEGINASDSLAMSYLLRAHNQFSGLNHDVIFYLAIMHDAGRGGNAENLDSEYWYKKLPDASWASWQGVRWRHALRKIRDGRYSDGFKNPNRALSYFMTVSELCIPEAEYTAAVLLSSGLGSPMVAKWYFNRASRSSDMRKKD